VRAPTIVIVGAGREVVGFTQDDSAVDVEFSDDTSPNGYGMTSAVDQWCPLVNFFPTLQAATDWAAQSGTPGRPLPVAGIALQMIERWRMILNHWPPG
jgi:hypothetical protein